MRTFVWLGSLVCLIALLACGTPEPKPLPPGPRPTDSTMPLPWNPPEATGPVPGALSDGRPDGQGRSCHTSSDCLGTFNHCALDVASLPGICTRECSQPSDCGSQGLWSCGDIVWDLQTQETKSACILSCLIDGECPLGTQCQNNHICGNVPVPPQDPVSGR